MLTLGSPTRCSCLLLPLLLALASAAGCQPAQRPPTPTPSLGTSLERLDRFEIDREALSDLGYRIDWRSTVPLGTNPRLAFLDAFDDVVVVQTMDTVISILDSQTGAVRNTNELSDRSTTLVGNLRLRNAVVSCTNSDAFFLDPTSGEILDRQKFEGVLSSEPINFGDLLLATTIDGIVIAHTTALGGYSQWRFGTRDPIDASPVVAGQSVVVVSRSGRVVALDASSGMLLGENSIFAGPRENNPVASDTTVFVASPDQSIYAFDAIDAALVWRVRTASPLLRQPTLIGPTLYVPTEDQGLLALDATTGQRLWNAPDVRGVVLTDNDGRLIVWGQGRVWSIDASDGATRTVHDLPGIIEMLADNVSNGLLYAVSEGRVVARLVHRR